MANNNTPLINYNSRDFASIKADLINYITNYHSDLFSYFNENSPDMVYRLNKNLCMEGLWRHLCQYEYGLCVGLFGGRFGW